MTKHLKPPQPQADTAKVLERSHQGDALAHYLHGVRRTELFTPEEEYAAAMKVRAGESDERIGEGIQLTINAIATALRNSG